MKKKGSIRVFAAVMVLILACVQVRLPVSGGSRLRVAVCAQMPPFQFIDEHNNITGLHIAYLNYIARLQNYELEYIPYLRVSEAVYALRNGTVDIVLGALPADVSNEDGIRFTEALSSGTVCMVMKNDRLDKMLYQEENRERYRIAFELGTVSFSQLSQLTLTYCTVMGTQQQLYNALTEGTIDAAVCVKESMLYMLDENKLRSSYTITQNNITDVDHRLLVRESDRYLYTFLNGAINKLRTSSAYDQLRAQWVVNMEVADAKSSYRALVRIALLIGSIALIVIVAVYYMNTRLKVLVSEKTCELQEQMGQLAAAGELRNRLIEHSPGGNLLLRRDGTILLANSVAREMAGVQGQAPPGNIGEMPVFGVIWRRCLTAPRLEMIAPELVALDIGDAKKHTFRYQCHETSVREEVVLLVEDVTWEENKKQEIFEERKNQTLNRIIAGVAHEIKNPLMSIRTFSSLIQTQGSEPEFQEAFFEYVPREVDRISKMIETLINYSRPPRAGKSRVCISDLAKDCVGLAYLSAKNKIELVYDVAPDLYVFANGDQLRQALVNLLINAIEAVEARQKEQPDAQLGIRVTGRRQDGRIVLESYDQGSGMSEEAILQCTDPFFTTKKSGTGMGLAMTKQYVRENDGRLEIESVLGQYTVMRMIFKEDTGYEAEYMDH